MWLDRRMATALVLIIFVVLPTVASILRRVDDAAHARFLAELAAFQNQQRMLRKG